MVARRNFNRHSIRLKEYDYSQPGFYFVTICVKNRQSVFGEIVEGCDKFTEPEIELSVLGEIVKNTWLSMPKHHNVEVDEFIVMPNHIHGIVVIKNRRGVARYAPTRDFVKQPAGSLATVICSFKSESSKLIHRVIGWEDFSWQRNYYEHVIRDEKSLTKIKNYIIDNYRKWHDDIENSNNNFSKSLVRQHYDLIFGQN